MTIEKDSNDAESYASYNPYTLNNMSDAGSDAGLSTTDSVSFRKLGSLTSKAKAMGRLDSVNNHHKTTLGGVQKVKELMDVSVISSFIQYPEDMCVEDPMYQEIELKRKLIVKLISFCL
jgi:hypothetical protein